MSRVVPISSRPAADKKPTATEIAATFWGERAPDWVIELARQCDASSQADVARAIGRSPALVSQVLRNRYPGDMEAAEDLVRGVFLEGTVECPALGTVPLNECREWRRKSVRFDNTNSLKVRMYRACNRCPVNRRETTP